MEGTTSLSSTYRVIFCFCCGLLALSRIWVITAFSRLSSLFPIPCNRNFTVSFFQLPIFSAWWVGLGPHINWERRDLLVFAKLLWSTWEGKSQTRRSCYIFHFQHPLYWVAVGIYYSQLLPSFLLQPLDHSLFVSLICLFVLTIGESQCRRWLKRKWSKSRTWMWILEPEGMETHCRITWCSIQRVLHHGCRWMELPRTDLRLPSALTLYFLLEAFRLFIFPR